MSDTAAEPRSELEQPIWAISWRMGAWPIRNGITYNTAVQARKTAELNHPNDEFTIITFEAARRQPFAKLGL